MALLWAYGLLLWDEIALTAIIWSRFGIQAHSIPINHHFQSRHAATEKRETKHNFRIPKNESRWGYWSSPTASVRWLSGCPVSISLPRALDLDVAHDLTAARGFGRPAGWPCVFRPSLWMGQDTVWSVAGPSGSLLGFPQCRKMKSWAKRARWGQGGLRFRIKPTKWAPRCQSAASRRAFE